MTQEPSWNNPYSAWVKLGHTSTFCFQLAMTTLSWKEDYATNRRRLSEGSLKKGGSRLDVKMEKIKENILSGERNTT